MDIISCKVNEVKEVDDVKTILFDYDIVLKLMFFNLVAGIIFAFIKSSHSGGIIQLNIHYLLGL